MKIRTQKIIDLQEWNETVRKVYGRPYNLQQQDGCHGRGLIRFSVPYEDESDFENDSIPEEVNGPIQGVSFKAWLERNPEQKLSNPEDQEVFCLELWWNRNFYPSLGAVVDDLHEKGLLEAGDYAIEIEW